MPAAATGRIVPYKLAVPQPEIRTSRFVAAAPAAAAGAAVAVEEEQDEFEVILQSVGDKKIQVIKVIREVTSLGLKEAKDLVDSAPSTVKDAATKDEAAQIKAKLEEQGASVTLK